MEGPFKLPQDNSRAQMELGAQGADRTWDTLIRHYGDAYFTGFMARMFALHAAASSAQRSEQIFDAVALGVKSTAIFAKKDKP